jgi:SNF2 family DNA or RNA helicase
MRISYNPRQHQKIAYNFALTRPYSGLLLDMGLGKTIVTLTLLKHLLDCFEIEKPLIIAPKLVCEQTWPDEIDKWVHTEGITYSIIAGTPTQRLRALRKPADVYIISCDNIVWLILLKRFAKRWPFDMMVVDEASKFKSQDSQRFKAVKRARSHPNTKRVLLLTGTPIPNGLLDIWAPTYLLDRGERLNKNITYFRAKYFTPIALSHGGHKYSLNAGCEELIYDQVSDLYLSMKAVDWLTLPERQDIIREVVLTEQELADYKQFKKDKVLTLPEASVAAFNATTLYTKLLQFSNGAVYDTDRKYHVIHNKKLDAIEEAVEELNGKPVIIFYQFQSDLERLKKRFPIAREASKPEHLREWNRGEMPIMLAHAASKGHGLNLQDGGNYIFWYGIGPNMEHYWQAVKRLDRQGQTQVVFNYHFLVKGTAEYKVYDSLMSKTVTQDKFMTAMTKAVYE